MSDFPNDDQADALRTLAERVNGFVYAGDRLNAVVDTVKALRADPKLAAMLLGSDLSDAIKVLAYVSAGRGYVDVEPYPDALARRALGALDDAGLITEEEVGDVN